MVTDLPDDDPWLNLPDDLNGTDTEEPQSYLLVERIDGFAPLDDQMGVWPQKTVPDALSEPLFGQPDPTDAEIRHYGSAEKVPALKTYIILDAAKLCMGVTEFENCDMAFCSLFKGEAAQNYADVCPYLIELKPDLEFTCRLFTYCPNVPAQMTTVHLWHTEPGIYIRSRASMDQLRRHFRKFTKLYSRETDSWTYFRFYEPATLRGMIANFGEAPFESFARLCHAFLGQSDDGSMVQITRRNGVAPLVPIEDEEAAD